MDLSFANPAGFWALLGIPAILLIHFLQRESRRITTSTLFLIEQLSPVSAQGRRFERLRNSIPLWLQLLAVLLLTWLLVQPRWLRQESTQSIVVVLDSSASMQVFRDVTIRRLTDRLAGMQRSASRTEWVLIESDTTRPTLYSGGELAGLASALAQWQPLLGAHDPAAALRVARTLLRQKGVVIFVSDHPQQTPEGVELFAAGEAIDNCGFAGVRVEEDTWHVLVKNHSASPQERSWWIESPAGNTAPAPLQLAPGQAQALHGKFPAGADRSELVLTSDRFTLDDRLPLVRPRPKQLHIAAEAGTPLQPFLERLLASIPNATAAAASADLHLASYSASATAPAVLFSTAAEAPQKYLTGELVAEKHPLTADLSWQGLLCQDAPAIPAEDGDEPLLWQGARPLLFLRGAGAAKSLVVNFDVRLSNADRLPAFVVLLHRFVETVRAAKVAPEQRNVETNQLLTVAAAPGGPPLVLKGAAAALPVLRAPAEPGFFEIAQGGETLLTAAAHFADPREADFREAAAVDQLAVVSAELAASNSREDFLVPLWAVLLGAVFLGNWALTGRSSA